MATSEFAGSGPAAVKMRSRSGSAYAALIAGVLCISFTAIFTKIANVPGPVAAAYRMTIAAAVLTIPFAWHVQRSGLPRVGVRWGLFGGIWFALNLGLLSSALLRTSAATATLLDNTAPIWVGLGALIFFHEKLGRRYWAGRGAGAGRRGRGHRVSSVRRGRPEYRRRDGVCRRDLLRRLPAEHAARPPRSGFAVLPVAGGSDRGAGPAGLLPGHRAAAAGLQRDPPI